MVGTVLGGEALSLLTKPATYGVILCVGLGVAVGVQTLRLNNAKHDEAVAKAALIDPATKGKWSDEYAAASGRLASCTAGVANLEGAIAVSNAAARAQAEKDAAALADAERAVAAQRSRLATVQGRLAKLSGPLAGATPAARCASAWTQFQSTLTPEPAK